MWPEGGAEPGVQYIRVLLHVRRAAMDTSVGVVHSHRRLPAILAVPDGEAMSPPELPADAPVADVLHPVEVYHGETLGDDLNAPVNHRFDRWSSQRRHLDKPLPGGQRLNHSSAALAMTYRVGVRFDLDQQPLFLQVCQQGMARGKTVLPLIWAGVFIQRGIRIHYVNERQLFSLRDLEVDRVMCRGNLHRAAAEGGVHGIIGNNGNLAPDRRQDSAPPHKVFVPPVLGIDGNGGIAEKGLRTGGGYGYEFLSRLPIRSRGRP
ncbi:MAG: hypothetical protein DDT24_00134 [Chloroflexi bacterium]|nr:hypothetical protein [Chloroflexota bacterium]